MIQSIQKIIKIGSSGGVTIPAKEMKRQNFKFGDDVEVIVRQIKNVKTDDALVIELANKTLNDYKADFKNLAKR